MTAPQNLVDAARAHFLERCQAMLTEASEEARRRGGFYAVIDHDRLQATAMSIITPYANASSDWPSPRSIVGAALWPALVEQGHYKQEDSYILLAVSPATVRQYTRLMAPHARAVMEPILAARRARLD
jgi:hypothetical protein